MSQMIEECTARAIETDWDEVSTRSYDMWALARVWERSRLGPLKITSDAIEFLDWEEIRCADVDTAVLTYVRGISPAYFLRIRAKGKSYQFLVEGREHFRGDLPFAVRKEVTTGVTWLRILLATAAAAVFLASLVWRMRR